MDNADITAIMPEENIYKVAYPSTVKIVNGQLVYIMLDISKPVNTFLDLRQYFNGRTGRPRERPAIDVRPKRTPAKYGRLHR